MPKAVNGFRLAAVAGGHCLAFKTQWRCSLVAISLTSALIQCDQVTRLPRSQRWSVPHAPSAALSRNLADLAVVLVMVLGSRTAEMLATQSLIIHGSRAFRLAQVGYVKRMSATCILVDFILLRTVLVIILHVILTMHSQQ